MSICTLCYWIYFFPYRYFPHLNMKRLLASFEIKVKSFFIYWDYLTRSFLSCLINYVMCILRPWPEHPTWKDSTISGLIIYLSSSPGWGLDISRTGNWQTSILIVERSASEDARQIKIKSLLDSTSEGCRSGFHQSE